MVFFKEIESAQIAFHSPLLNENACHNVRFALSEFINHEFSSSKWIHGFESNNFADLLVENLRKEVQFRDTFSKLPEGVSFLLFFIFQFIVVDYRSGTAYFKIDLQG